MMTRACFWLAASIVLLLPAGVRADDLSDAERLICATVKATECYADGTCIQGEPEDWNIPRFMRVDLAEKTLSTTRASGEERATPLQILNHDEDRIFAQGAQTGRAVSLVINQRSGVASAGIVLDGHILSVFAHCTPLESEN